MAAKSFLEFLATIGTFFAANGIPFLNMLTFALSFPYAISNSASSFVSSFAYVVVVCYLIMFLVAIWASFASSFPLKFGGRIYSRFFRPLLIICLVLVIASFAIFCIAAVATRPEDSTTQQLVILVLVLGLTALIQVAVGAYLFAAHAAIAVELSPAYGGPPRGEIRSPVFNYHSAHVYLAVARVANFIILCFLISRISTIGSETVWRALGVSAIICLVFTGLIIACVWRGRCIGPIKRSRIVSLVITLLLLVYTLCALLESVAGVYTRAVDYEEFDEATAGSTRALVAVCLADAVHALYLLPMLLRISVSDEEQLRSGDSRAGSARPAVISHNDGDGDEGGDNEMHELREEGEFEDEDMRDDGRTRV
eukprot:TRINITY_DN8279_c0_g1_i1.p1 TRINITY_DN8279_c0_g1~~TRINITY_DN8279_c0_g1_i1.p1  ORF type:complete len:382 (+),score=45.42 TRINITY_DN8279_c0_g1_i1:44-1147(+)